MSTWTNGVEYEELMSGNPIGYLGESLIINQINDRGVEDAFVITPGGKPQSITSTLNDLVITNRGASDVNGFNVLLEVAVGPLAMLALSQVGRGTSNEIWLLDMKTNTGYPLVTGRPGTIWARFNPAGTRIIWSELVTTPFDTHDEANYVFGFWQLHTADITPTGIANETVYNNPSYFGNAFYEPYGWIDNDTLIFASDYGMTPVKNVAHWLLMQIWTMPDTPNAIPTRLSPPVSGRTPLHEFAYQAPVGMFDDTDDWVIFGMALGTIGSDGLDLWKMLRTDTTGASLERLTYFNGLFGYANVGQVCWTENPKTMLIGVSNVCYEVTVP